MIPGTKRPSSPAGRPTAAAAEAAAPGAARRPPRAPRRLPALTILLAFAFHAASADINLPPRILNPLSAAEAWNVIRLAADNVERLIAEERPLEVADQISLCSRSLRVLARTATTVTGGQPSAIDDSFTRAYRSVNLIAQESAANNLVGVQSIFAELKKALRELEPAFDAAAIHAEIYHCPDHPDVIAKDPGRKCDQENCGRELLARRIPYSFIYVKPVHPTLRLDARIDAPLRAGRESQVTLRLETLEGRPVVPADLQITHTLRVHVLVTGPDRQDFHFRAPAISTSGSAGEYTFSFTPSLPGPYRVWAGAIPHATGLQEYPVAELPAEADAPADTQAEEIFTGAAGGVTFQLFIAGSGGFKARAGMTQMIRLRVTNTAGEPFQELEPLLNAFAHLNGFYTEHETLLQLHPVGGDILAEEARGGPDLAFKFYAPRAGLLRLYCQARVGGKDVVIPFAIRVLE